VQVDGDAVLSCSTLAIQCDGRAVRTVEGLQAADGTLHPIQQAFHENHGLQCGYCTPGMMMAAVGIIEQQPNATDEEIRDALEGNLCRCTGYQNIVASIRAAADQMARS
jgi:carbon-monoxide dehydrogenase small subunit